MGEDSDDKPARLSGPPHVLVAWFGAIMAAASMIGLIVTATGSLDQIRADTKDNAAAISEVQDRMQRSNLQARVQILEDRVQSEQQDQASIRAEFHDIQTTLNTEVQQIATLSAKLDILLTGQPMMNARGARSDR